MNLNLFEMGYLSLRNRAIRYRGFLLIEQENKSWVARPEKSPIIIFPFKTNPCSLVEVKKIIDLKLANQKEMINAA
tara:strand:- start:601 stop:828 length:228 start_codon:yes stop_codon:yes gene_type:complete